MVVSNGPPGWWVTALVLVLILGIGGAIVRLFVRGSVLRKGGLNPFVDKEQLEVKIARGLDRLDASSAPAEPSAEQSRKSIEERLAELDDLHQRGIISDEELKEARAKVIADG